MVALQPERKRSSQVIPLRGMCVGTVAEDRGRGRRCRETAAAVQIRAHQERRKNDANERQKYHQQTHWFPSFPGIETGIRINSNEYIALVKARADLRQGGLGRRGKCLASFRGTLDSVICVNAFDLLQQLFV